MYEIFETGRQAGKKQDLTPLRKSLKCIFVVYFFDLAKKVLWIMIKCKYPVFLDSLLEVFPLILQCLLGKKIIAHAVRQPYMS